MNQVALGPSDTGMNSFANNLCFRGKQADAALKAMRLRTQESTKCQSDTVELRPGAVRLATLDAAELFDAAVILLYGVGVPSVLHPL